MSSNYWTTRFNPSSAGLNYADIRMKPQDLPATVHSKILANLRPGKGTFIPNRIQKILANDALDPLSAEDAFTLSHLAQERLVLDSRFGLEVQKHPSTTELFGKDLELHEWLREQTTCNPENWYTDFQKWMENLPESILSFGRSPDGEIHLHHLLLDYAVVRDLLYPRPLGVVWAPIPNAHEYGFRFSLSAETKSATVGVSNYKIPANTFFGKQEADLRLWIPVYVMFQVKYAYREGDEWKTDFFLDIVKDTSSSNHSLFRVRKVGSSNIIRGESGSAQFSFKSSVMELRVEFENIFKRKPEAWLAFAEIVYARTAESPSDASGIFKDLNETTEIPEENFGYYILGSYRAPPSGTAAAIFGWF